MVHGSLLYYRSKNQRLFAERLRKEAGERKFTLLEPSGEVVSCGGHPGANPCDEGGESANLLIQVLFLQGDARRLAKEPYIQQLTHWIGQSSSPTLYRNLFERIVSFRSRDLETFLSSKKLQNALIGK